MYLGWHDDTKNKPTADKIAEAVQRYKEKFGKEPSLLLCNPQDVVQYPGLTVEAKDYIRKNNFWVALDDL